MGKIKIDSHLHVNYKGLSPRRLIEYLDRHRIDRCWLLTWEEAAPLNPDYLPLPIEHVMEAYREYPFRIVPFYAPDPSKQDAVEKFLAYREKGVMGCGELKAAIKWDSYELDPLLACLDNMGLPLVFHMEGCGCMFAPEKDTVSDRVIAKMLNTPRYRGVPRLLLEGAERVIPPLKRKKDRMRTFFPGYMLDFASLESRLKEYKNIKFVGHGPLFWRGISAVMERGAHSMPRGPVLGEGIVCRLLAEYGNLYADLSAHSGYNALRRDPAFARKFLIRYSRKLLYGTDNFFLGLKPFLESLGLPGEVKDRIYGGNAEGLLRPSEAGGRARAAEGVKAWRKAS